MHEQWVAGPTDSVREQLTRLADDLVIPYSVVLTEEAFSDSTVLGFYDHIQHDYNELARRLTREALLKASTE